MSSSLLRKSLQLFEEKEETKRNGEQSNHTGNAGAFHFTGKTGIASIAAPVLPLMENVNGDFGNVNKRCRVWRRRCRRGHVNGKHPNVILSVFSC